jgi:hypothetical protein
MIKINDNGWCELKTEIEIFYLLNNLNILPMSKARFLLIIIFIFSILGGVMASKGSRVSHPFYSASNGLCTVPTNILYTTYNADAINPIPIIQTTYYSELIFGPCPTLTIYRAL